MLISTHLGTNCVRSTWTQDMPWPCHASVLTVIYLNNILIFLEDPKKHIEAVCQVLKRLHIYKLFVNLKKCVFRTDIVEFLGFLVGLKGIKIDLSQVKAI